MATPFKLITMAEMMTRQSEHPPAYFIDQVMKSNTFNLFVGEADAGKSCLTRQLAACVVTGTAFLGWKVQQSSVLYFTVEQDPEQISVEMNTLGLGAEHKFYLSRDEAETPEKFVENLRATLQRDPSIKFVVLDTLVRFLPKVNIDSYSETTPHTLNFQKLCYDCGVTILALHHYNKHGLSLSTKISGSNSLKGAADTTLALWGAGKAKRYLESDGRCKHIPRTLVDFDEITRISTLVTGTGSVSKTKLPPSEVVAELGGASASEVIKANPGITLKDLVARMDGRKADKFAEVKKLVANGLVVESGSGLKGAPHTYTETSAPVATPASITPIAVVSTRAPVNSAPAISLDDQISALSMEIRTERDSERRTELMVQRAKLQARNRKAA